MDTTQPVRLTIRPARQTHLTHGFCGQIADIWANSVGGKRLINSTFSWLDAVQCVASCQIIVVNLDCKTFINTSWRQIGASRKYSTSLFSHWIILISRTNSSQFGLSVKSWKKTHWQRYPFEENEIFWNCLAIQHIVGRDGIWRQEPSRTAFHWIFLASFVSLRNSNISALVCSWRAAPARMS